MTQTLQRQQQIRQALGCEIQLTLVGDDVRKLDHFFTELWKLIADFDRRFSRFLPDSEVTLLNNSAGHWQAISPEMSRMLEAVSLMTRQTGGLFNPFILPDLQRAGYLGSWPHPQTAGTTPDYTDRQRVPAEQLELRSGSARIPKDSALDLGGIGKGYLLDELAELLDGFELGGYWLSLGGDILCSGHDADGNDWQIGVGHALDNSRIVRLLSSHGAPLAVATSGITKRRGIHNGQSWHHIIDPRSGKPAKTGFLTVTVWGKRGLDTDIAATCLHLTPPGQRAGLLRRLHVAGGLGQIQASPGKVQVIELEQKP